MSLETSNRLRRVEQTLCGLQEQILKVVNVCHLLRDDLAKMRTEMEENYARKRGPKVVKSNGDETRPAD